MVSRCHTYILEASHLCRNSTFALLTLQHLELMYPSREKLQIRRNAERQSYQCIDRSRTNTMPSEIKWFQRPRCNTAPNIAAYCTILAQVCEAVAIARRSQAQNGVGATFVRAWYTVHATIHQHSLTRPVKERTVNLAALPRPPRVAAEERLRLPAAVAADLSPALLEAYR